MIAQRQLEAQGACLVASCATKEPCWGGGKKARNVKHGGHSCRGGGWRQWFLFREAQSSFLSSLGCEKEGNAIKAAFEEEQNTLLVTPHHLLDSLPTEYFLDPSVPVQLGNPYATSRFAS